MTKAEAIADAVLEVLNRRKGFDHWWYDIAEDVQQDIREALAARIEDYEDYEED